MSKTKLPSDCTTTARPIGLEPLHPVRVAADHEVGPGCGEGPGGGPLAARLGAMGVLGAPVGQHHDGVDPVSPSAAMSAA